MAYVYQTLLFFLSFLYIFRWSPSCYILLKPSAVWGYTSLRIWDRLTVGRVSASLSRSALIYMIRLKFPGIKLLREFLRYHTFALCYSSRLGNSGNFCVCNPECRKLFLVESRIQVPLTRNLQAVTWNSEFTAWNQEFDYLKWSDYLFIYLLNAAGSKASLSRWLAFARSNRRHGNQRWWIENCYTGLYFAYSILTWLTATVVIDYWSIDKLWLCL